MWLSVALPLWFIGFFLGVAGLFVWQVKRSGTRPPIKFKLLRGPGESLRRKIAKLDEDMLGDVIGTSFFPIFLGAVVILLLVKSGRDALLYGAIPAIILFILVTYLCGRRTWRMLRDRRNWLLGYLGERAVAENLEPLVADGYRIFHDMPADGREKPFNLDHVVVGPSGVWVVETKTRRKGRARPGFTDHEVTFDGRQLIWPWGEDTHGIDQAIAEADWLRKWIEQRTGLKVAVKPILTLPGWYVHEKPGNGIRVVNSKILPSAIRGRDDRALTDEQIKLISLQLDLVCRDVED